MYEGILVGYFGKWDEARKAFKQLRRKGYRRAAWASKSVDGDVRIGDPFPWRRALGAIAAFILSGAIVSFVAMRPEWSGPALRGFFPIPVLVGGVTGALLFVAWMRRSAFGVRRKLIEDHARWLVSGESVLILQAPIETLQGPVAWSLLRAVEVAQRSSL